MTTTACPSLSSLSTLYTPVPCSSRPSLHSTRVQPAFQTYPAVIIHFTILPSETTTIVRSVTLATLPVPSHAVHPVQEASDREQCHPAARCLHAWTTSGRYTRPDGLVHARGSQNPAGEQAEECEVRWVYCIPSQLVTLLLTLSSLVQPSRRDMQSRQEHRCRWIHEPAIDERRSTDDKAQPGIIAPRIAPNQASCQATPPTPKAPSHSLHPHPHLGLSWQCATLLHPQPTLPLRAVLHSHITTQLRVY